MKLARNNDRVLASNEKDVFAQFRFPAAITSRPLFSRFCKAAEPLNAH
jgi:hypothetical protein